MWGMGMQWASFLAWWSRVWCVKFGGGWLWVMLAVFCHLGCLFLALRLSSMWRDVGAFMVFSVWRMSLGWCVFFADCVGIFQVLVDFLRGNAWGSDVGECLFFVPILWWEDGQINVYGGWCVWSFRTRLYMYISVNVRWVHSSPAWKQVSSSGTTHRTPSGASVACPLWCSDVWVWMCTCLCRWCASVRMRFVKNTWRQYGMG